MEYKQPSGFVVKPYHKEVDMVYNLQLMNHTNYLKTILRRCDLLGAVYLIKFNQLS